MVARSLVLALLLVAVVPRGGLARVSSSDRPNSFGAGCGYLQDRYDALAREYNDPATTQARRDQILGIATSPSSVSTVATRTPRSVVTEVGKLATTSTREVR